MPHRNRVTPYGEIVAIPERGTLMGNRGVIHADDGSHRREWQVRRWIACRLEFKGRHREIRRPRRWTELFFLDEATALAAGHRPCAECRREDYRRWQAAWPGRTPAPTPWTSSCTPTGSTGAPSARTPRALGELPGRRRSSSGAGGRGCWPAGPCGRGRRRATAPPSGPRAGETVTVLTPAVTVAVIAARLRARAAPVRA